MSNATQDLFVSALSGPNTSHAELLEACKAFVAAYQLAPHVALDPAFDLAVKAIKKAEGA